MSSFFSRFVAMGMTTMILLAAVLPGVAAAQDFGWPVYPQFYVNVVDVELNQDTDGDLRHSIDFGAVDVAETETRTISFDNDSDFDVEMSIRQTGGNSDDVFSFDDTTLEIEEGDSETLQIKAAPDSRGEFFEQYAITFVPQSNYGYGSVTFILDLEVNGFEDNNDARSSDEDLITDFEVDTDQNLYAYPTAAIKVEFELERDSYLSLDVCDEDGRNCLRVFTDNFFNAVTSGDEFVFVLPRALDSNMEYEVKLRAESRNGDFVDTDTDTIGRNNSVRPRPIDPIYPPVGGGCEGFVDVAPNSEFCQAVEFAVDRGIFQGDDVAGPYGRTLRPDDALTRAEAVMVLTRTGKVKLSDTRTPLPFYDIDERAYYIPALREAVRLGAIRGYNDGTFRPAQTMNRAEFYKAFLEFVRARGVGNFILSYDKFYSPFSDVTWTEMRWFVPYADWAVRYFDRSPEAQRWYGTSLLVESEAAYFQPGAEITRGHIIELIYAMSKRDMLNI